MLNSILKLDFNLFDDDILQPQPYMHGLFSNFNQDKIVIKQKKLNWGVERYLVDCQQHHSNKITKF